MQKTGYILAGLCQGCLLAETAGSLAGSEAMQGQGPLAPTYSQAPPQPACPGGLARITGVPHRGTLLISPHSISSALLK